MRRQTGISLKLNRRRAAFTLIEVLLVLAIIGVIAALAVPNFLGKQQEALVKATQAKIKGLEQVAQMYAVDNDGVYPQGNTETVMAMLMNPGNDKNGRPRKPYLDEVPTDAWGNPLNYDSNVGGNRQTPGGKPAIWSAGPNKTDGDEDDVTNWNQKL